MTFQDFSLSPALLRGVADHGYVTPTPIQQQAIPLALEGRDLIASAQTGTGKTAAFLLPALQRLETQKPVRRSAPRILILTPTRELAGQILAEGKAYAKHTRGVAQGCIVGGVSFGPQLNLLSQRIDLLVATPGRLIDHLERGSVRLDQVELLVLDEADRMLDMGFIHAVRRIVGKLPRPRQTLFFTATWDDRLAKLTQEMLVDPARVAVAPTVRTADKITQRVHLADDGAHKDKLLRHLLAHGAEGSGGGTTIVFAGTKRRVKKLAEALERQGLPVGALHGDMKQSQRNKALDGLKRNQVRILVATDVAARGIDVTELALVVNYDMPMLAEDYVHRIGRTGRAGATGIAVSLVTPDDRPLLTDVEKLTGNTIERAVIEGLEPVVVELPPGFKPAGRSRRGGRQGQGQPQRGQQPRPQAARNGHGQGHGHGHGHGHGGHGKAAPKKPHQPARAAQGPRPQRPAAAAPATPPPALDEHRPAFLMRKVAR